MSAAPHTPSTLRTFDDFLALCFEELIGPCFAGGPGTFTRDVPNHCVIHLNTRSLPKDCTVILRVNAPDA